MRLPVALLGLILLTPLLAGCFGGPSPAPTPTPTPTPGPGGAKSPSPSPSPTLSTPRPPTPQRVSFGGASNEVSIAVDPTNPLRILVGAKDYSLFFEPPCDRFNVWSGVYVTSDGGRFWRHTVLPGFKFDQRPSAIIGYRCTSDPVVAFDTKGTAYYAGLAFGYANETGPVSQPGAPPVPVPVPIPPPPVPVPPPPQPPNETKNVTLPEPSALFLFTSKDGGLTWDAGHIVIEDKTGALFQDKEALVIDPASGTIYLAWSMQAQPPVPGGLPLPAQPPATPGPGSVPQLVVAHSTDAGATWSQPVPLSATPPTSLGSGIALAVLPDGKVVAVFLGTDAQGASTLYASLSTDQGQTFQPATAIAPVHEIPNPLPNSKFRAATMPSLSVDPATGTILVAWNDAGSGNSDIVVSTSKDGAAWSKALIVHADPSNDQFFPAAAWNSKGEALLLYYDRRSDPANTLVQVSVARSADQGQTWNESLLLQPAFNGDASLHQRGTPFLGDYIGLSSGGNVTWAAWTATPFQRGDVFVQKV